MSNHIGKRKNLYFSADEVDLLETIKTIGNVSGCQFSTVTKQLIRHGIKPYLQATGTQLELPLATNEVQAQ